MADVKISQLPAKGSNIAATDRIMISEDSGGGAFASKYVTGSEIINVKKNSYSKKHTLVIEDANCFVELNYAVAENLTIPTNASVSFLAGTIIILTQYGDGQVTVTPDAGVTLRSINAKNKTTGKYSVAYLYKRDTNEWYLYGDITS